MLLNCVSHRVETITPHSLEWVGSGGTRGGVAMRRFLALVALVAAALMVGAPAAGAKTYKPGQTATTSGFKVTVFGITEPWTSTNQFDTPDPGTHYVAVDVQIKNTGSEQETFSSLLGYHLIDGTNRQYDIKLGCIGLEPGAPEGQMPPKQPIRGNVCFQVPDGSTKLKLRVQGSFTAEGSLFQLTNKLGQPVPGVTPKA